MEGLRLGVLLTIADSLLFWPYHDLHRWRVYAHPPRPALRTVTASLEPLVTTPSAAQCARPAPVVSATSSVMCRVVSASPCVDAMVTVAVARSATTSCAPSAAAATTPALRTRLVSTASALVSSHTCYGIFFVLHFFILIFDCCL